VVNYVVTVTLNSGQTSLKIGMTADANIIVTNKDNVLLVPNTAIRAQSNRRFVTIPKGGDQVEEIEIKTGLSNDQETEILSGLHEGQSVIVSLIQQLPSGGFGTTRR